MKNRYIVIMAGGKGERFWPQSRLHRPKHLLPIVGDAPMLKQTIDRIGDIVPVENILVITNMEQAAAVADVCSSLPAENIIAEPVGRDTAAAVGLATLLVQMRCPDGAFAILPADHVIEDRRAFQGVLDEAFCLAEKGDALVTVGIPPVYSATGYGYIEKGNLIDADSSISAYEVNSFKEKPDSETAQRYLASGDYFWNAGMFFWRVASISNALEQFTPDLWKALQSIRSTIDAGASLSSALADSYPQLPKISVDYAIMEKAKEVLVVTSTFDWDDVGEWPAVERHFPADQNGNVIRGLVREVDSHRNIVLNTGDKLTALVGVEDLIVVETSDATLICHKDKAQQIKDLVKLIGEDEALKLLL